jgi:hypothetical protein
MGGEYRELYQAFKETFRLIRPVSGVVIMTATHKNYFPEEVLAASEFVIARRRFDEIVYERWTYARFRKLWYGDEYYFRALKPVWVDEIPKKAIFGLPTWLENEINERKIYTLKAVLDRVLKKNRGGGE